MEAFAARASTEFAASFKRLSRRDRVSHMWPATAATMCVILFFALVGSAEAAAPNASEDSERAARSAQPIGMEPAPDELLQERIESVLSRIEDFQGVSVEVSDGVAQLSGQIPRSDTMEKIERLVSRFEGVIYVDNKIKAATDVELRVGPLWGRVTEYMESFFARLPLIGVAIAVAALFWAIGSLIGGLAPRFGWFGVNPMIKNLVSRLLMAAFVVAGLIVALDILDVTALIGAVVGTAGIAGLAIGFAFKDIVENYLAGLLLSIRSLFSINDHVIIGDHEGRVVRLTSREMIIMTLDGNHVLIPNATVFKSVIVNFTRNFLRRFDFAAGVSVEEDLKSVRRVGLETLRAMNGVIHDPGPFMRIENLGDYAVTVRFFGWIDQRNADFFKVRSEAIRLVKEAFDEGGIEMPFPTYVRRRPEEIAREKPEPDEKPSRIEAEAAAAETSVDTQLDPQIEEDLKTSDESNYLEREGRR